MLGNVDKMTDDLIYRLYESLFNEIKILLKERDLVPDLTLEDEEYSPFLQSNDVDMNHALPFIKGLIKFAHDGKFESESQQKTRKRASVYETTPEMCNSPRFILSMPQMSPFS